MTQDLIIGYLAMPFAVYQFGVLRGLSSRIAFFRAVVVLMLAYAGNGKAIFNGRPWALYCITACFFAPRSISFLATRL